MRQCTKSEGCLKKTLAAEDGFLYCPNQSGYRDKIRIPFGRFGRISIFKFNNISQCNSIGFPQCDNSTCYVSRFMTCSGNDCIASDYQICTSYCSGTPYCASRNVLQCNDGGYIFLDHFCDGVFDCNDESDEEQWASSFVCNGCTLPQSNLYDDVAHCKDGSDLCFGSNNMSCFKCDDRPWFISAKQVCDGETDCSDGSDEFVGCGVSPFQCFDEYINISFNYVCDGKGDCYDYSDECTADCENSCFKCLSYPENGPFFIPSKQVCDGSFDCPSTSDECLCDFNLFEGLMSCEPKFKETYRTCVESEEFTSSLNSFKIKVVSSQPAPGKWCKSRTGETNAIFCDGRPECKDYSDEEFCDDPHPLFRDNQCYSYFLMGDRYCDGVEDPAWKLINDTNCPKGFDEILCPKRFMCQAEGNVSIDISQKCDGKPDCDDHSDENDCSSDNIFSSNSEMIANSAIKSAFWIIGFVVVLSNVCVIVSTLSFIRKNKGKVSDNLIFQHIIILNISIADFLMGVYLITIAAYSAKFSGYYGSVDSKWRSSLECSVIGSLAVTSSQASCFLMVVLTAFRLVNIFWPLKFLSASLILWKICLGLSWLLSLSLAIAPILDVTSTYFVHTLSFTSMFHKDGEVSLTDLWAFLCSYANWNNKTLTNYGSALKTTEMFIKQHLPHSAPVQMFGYYAETSVCMPRFYVVLGDPSWEYTLSVITVNFICFLFIAVSYILIFRHSSKSSAEVRNSKSDEQAAKMQKRITRIVATDFFCWIPICIMAYVRLGVEFENIVYQITAVLLLPINSALNPFLFSSLPDKLIKLCERFKLYSIRR